MVRPKRTKPDKNQAEIVAELRVLGFDVDIVCDLPGIYDLVVSGQRWEYPDDYFDVAVRVEVKSEGGKLNDTEEKYFENQKHKGSLIVAYCTEDILRWFGT